MDLKLVIIIPIAMTIIIHNHQKVIFCLLPYAGKPSHIFAKLFRTLIKNKCNVHLNLYYQMTKVSMYFQLKCATPFELFANVV